MQSKQIPCRHLPMNTQGKRIVVTGGSSGIGLALAHAFAEAGGHVVITGRSEARLTEAAASHANLTGMVCDVTRNEQVIALREAMDAGGGTDILVNNAGVMHAFDVTSDFPLESSWTRSTSTWPARSASFTTSCRGCSIGRR